MKTPMIIFSARCPCSGKTFELRMETPAKHAGSEDFFCRITSNLDSGFKVDAFGINATQAIELGIEIAAAKLSRELTRDVLDNPGIDPTTGVGTPWA